MCTQNESLDVTCTPSPSSELTFWYFNEHLDKGNLKKIISWLITYYGGLRTNGILERLKRLGFEQGLQAGVSIGVGILHPHQCETILYHPLVMVSWVRIVSIMQAK